MRISGPAPGAVIALVLCLPSTSAMGQVPERPEPTSAQAPPSPAPSPSAQPPAPRIVQPGAPGQPSREITAAEASDISAVHYTPADVRFMQGMIGHHAQALEMTALVASQSAAHDLRALAQRIEVSQADEIGMMQAWLSQRGEPVPDVSAHAHHADHAHDASLMPGMLTPEQMGALAEADGSRFRRLFLEGMIQHHQGALIMVRELFATPSAGQESEIFAFASDVEADQAMEIARMRALLEAGTK